MVHNANAIYTAAKPAVRQLLMTVSSHLRHIFKQHESSCVSGHNRNASHIQTTFTDHEQINAPSSASPCPAPRPARHTNPHTHSAPRQSYAGTSQPIVNQSPAKRHSPLLHSRCGQRHRLYTCQIHQSRPFNVTTALQLYTFDGCACACTSGNSSSSGISSMLQKGAS